MKHEDNTVLYFWNSACSVCRPLYEKLKHLVEDEFPDLTIQKIDIDNQPDLRAKYQVFSSPLILLLLDGKEYLRSSGNVSLHELRQKIQRLYQLKFNK